MQETLSTRARSWPFVVVRWMAAVYGTTPIAIVRTRGTAPALAIEVVDDEYVDGAPIDTRMRRKIIEAAAAKSAQMRFRMCVVFGSDDCVFVEPDGQTHASTEPPHGGLRLERGRR